jgi:hypothetical protein
MRDSPFYLVFLVVVILAMGGYLHATSEVVTVTIQDRYSETATRRFRERQVPMVVTDRGTYPMSGIPILGFMDRNAAAGRLEIGRSYRVRLARWPFSGPRGSHAIIDIIE